MVRPLQDDGARHGDKIDVDKEQRLAALFGVRSIPTFLFIPQSGDPQHAMGAMDITQMRRIIDEVLLKK